ncbi:MAG: pro-sigmaK processing inhibitor BofA family protein [Selenomonadaceae bacterium]|nr:pro-sigmaK processing inhibitor BofA family protein [Selenomonadaceae bacterium]
MLEFVVAFAIGLILLGILLKLLSLPLRLVWKFITNSVAGAVILWLVSLIGIPVKINIISALVAGIFGVPGVLAIIAYTYL